MPPTAPKWEPVEEPRLVFRFLKEPDKASPNFADNFKSDGERGKTLVEGEHPDLLKGMSVFESEAAARKRWHQLKNDAVRKRSEKNARRQKANPRPFKMSVGDHIGEVLLVSGQGFEILVEEPDPQGHLTIRGDKIRLAMRVSEVYAVESGADVA